MSHPFIFKRVEKRWKLGLSENFQSRLPHRLLLLLIMMLDAILTPVLLPLNAFVGSKDQQGHFVEKSLSQVRSPGNKTKKRSRLAELQGISIMYNSIFNRQQQHCIVWPVMRAGKMNQIACCDWLPEQARWSHLAP